ncbi:methyltransferase domain-containing protein [Streptomyces sp. NPDC003077]|uniref:class I SAM-dependent methyltransferase n=1 Tax=Streptomyces sp. NPDC003077 TaxID=3154443 RepID=UPI0033B8B446
MGPASYTPVQQELLARQLDEQIAARFPVGRRLDVLDAGPGGDGQALRLARAGHKVTALEPDPAALEAVRTELAGEPEGIQERVRLVQGDCGETGVHFTPGSFDLVLGHGVLMDAPEPDPLLAGLARMLAPGGLLSLVVRNADAPAMRAGIAGDWAGALAAFDSGAPRHRLEALTATLAGIGAPLHAWYGVGVFGEPSGSAAAADPAGALLAEGAWEALLSVEERAGKTDPYRAVGEFVHLCGVRD